MNVVKLNVLADYRSREIFYQKGITIEVTEVEWDFLQRDAPGCFEVWSAPEPKAPDAPPVDKMVKRHNADQK